MTKKIILMAMIVSLCTINFAYSAEQLDKNDPVYLGLEMYIKTHDADAALKEWLKGSALEEEKLTRAQVNSMKQIEDIIGLAISYDVISKKRITPKSEIVICSVNHEKGIDYYRFLKYQKPSGEWIIQEFHFFISPLAIFPSDMFFDK